MKLSQKQIGHIAMFSAATMFALNIPVGKYILSGYISPFGYTMARVGFATLAFWITSFFLKKDPVKPKDHLILLLGSVFGITLNQGVFVFGLGHTSPVDASIITTSSPLFAMIIAAIILKEPITTKKVSGVVLGILGAVMLIYTSHDGSDMREDSGAIGNIAIVCSSFSYAFYLVITKPLSSKYSPVTIMKWMFLYSTIMLAPFLTGDLIHAELFRQSDITPYLLLGYALFFATFLAYMLIPSAQKRIRPTTISMYNNLQPVIASFVAIMLAQDTFSWEKGAAGVLVFIGVYLVTQSKSKADLDAEKVS